MKRILILIIMINTLLFSKEIFSNYQIKNIKTAMEVGESIILPNGENIKLILGTLNFLEGSAGQSSKNHYIIYKGKKIKIILGDLEDNMYNKRIFINYKGLKKRVRVQNIYKNVNFNKISLGDMQIQLRTAKRTIKQTPELIHIKHLIHNDNELIRALLHDKRLSYLIAGYYIKLCYIESQKRFKNIPEKSYKHLLHAISRYNGGWNNERYLSQFRKKREQVKQFL